MFSEDKPVAVLIHGCHLQGNLKGRSWQNLIWGSDSDEPTLAGRVVMGIFVALHRRARVVTFSTGASEKDGLKEAEYTYQFVRAHVEPLAKLLSQMLNTPMTGVQLGQWLERRTVLDTVSQNTAEETVANLDVALSRKCKEVIGVTNAFHAPRCLAGLQDARIKKHSPLLVSVVPALDANEGTVIVEPPHRGDMPKVPFNETASRIFGFLKDPDIASEFNSAWSALIDDYKERQRRPVIFEGKAYYPTHPRIFELVKTSREPIQVWVAANAHRRGIQIRAVDPVDGKPRRMFIWENTDEQWGPTEPDSPAYGPDGEDTGW